MTWIKAGSTTGIGSVPYNSAEEGLKLVAHCMPDWPHWPQLPSSSLEEGFVLQYIQPLVRLGLVAWGKDIHFNRNSATWEENVLRFYELYLAWQNGEKEAEAFFALQGQSFHGLEYFVDNFFDYFQEANGVKGQLSGPLTVGLEIKDEQGKDAFYDENLRDLLVKCLQTQGVMQVKKLQTLKKDVVLFIDDPAIFLLGSATHITLTKEEISNALLEIMQPLKAMGTKIGVHICAQTDWSLLFDLLQIDVVSFDAYTYFSSMTAYVQALRRFLQRGGKIAWGIVPTSQMAWQLTVESLLSIFQEQVEQLVSLGLEKELLLKNIIWTPSCGTGTLTIELAQHIYLLLNNFAKQVKKWK